jgi:hypothetical protein
MLIYLSICGEREERKEREERGGVRKRWKEEKRNETKEKREHSQV